MIIKVGICILMTIFDAKKMTYRVCRKNPVFVCAINGFKFHVVVIDLIFFLFKVIPVNSHVSGVLWKCESSIKVIHESDRCLVDDG